MNSLLANEFIQFIVNTSTPKSTAITVSFWVFIALVLSVLVCALTVKGEKERKLCKIIFGIVIAVFTISVIATFLVFEGKEANDDKMSPMLYAPLTVFAIVLVLSVILNLFIQKGWLKSLSLFLIVASVIAVIVCLSVYYSSGDALDFNWVTSDQVHTLGLWLSSLGLVVIIVLAAIFTDKVRSLNFDVKSLAYAGVLGGLSFALSYVRIFKMPMGGSITLASVLPIMIYAYMFGTKKGVILGFVMGILQAVQDPWILHPAQFLLDYPIAFASFGLAGCFANLKSIKHHGVKLLLGGIIACALRFFAHFFSGIFAFEAFADLEKFSSVYAYSAVYQVTYVLPDTAIALVLGFLLMCSKSFTKIMLSACSNNGKKTAKKEEEKLAENKTDNAD